MSNRVTIKTLNALLPTIYWASYLINGDASGIDEGDIVDADAFVEFIGAGSPVDCTEAGFIAYSNARDWGFISVAADCCTYTFMRPVSP